ncbi:MAG: hypothetical protein JXA71_06275, partial [Chitinispirillaceae bacterium]|nr:hypothetical protein [Chitinispirillaceae bacterium]
PMVDTGRVTARYMRITVNSANLPTAADQIRTIIETDYADRVSVVEFKVFQESIPVSVSDNDVPQRMSPPLKRLGALTCVLQKAGVVSLNVIDISGRTVYCRAFSAPAGPLLLRTADLPLAPGTYIGTLTLPDGIKGGAVKLVK